MEICHEQGFVGQTTSPTGQIHAKQRADSISGTCYFLQSRNSRIEICNSRIKLGINCLPKPGPLLTCPSPPLCQKPSPIWYSMLLVVFLTCLDGPGGPHRPVRDFGILTTMCDTKGGDGHPMGVRCAAHATKVPNTVQAGVNQQLCGIAWDTKSCRQSTKPCLLEQWSSQSWRYT